MTGFLDNAQRILETAVSAGDNAGTESLAILIGADGGIHMVMGSDWPLDSLRAHHGAPSGYRVSRRGGRVEVEGKSREQTCLLTSAPALSAARQILTNRRQYLALTA